VDLIHQDLEPTIHDSMNFNGVELFGKVGEIGHIREYDRHELPFTFDGGSVGENFFDKMSWRVGLRSIVIHREIGGRRFEGMPAFIAEFASGGIDLATGRTCWLHFGAALVTELRAFGDSRTDTWRIPLFTST